MNFHHATADLFVPDNRWPDAAVHRVTHLGIGAHQDDLEIMAFHGIAECYSQSDKWFAGVVCTNGAGSPRAGAYAGYTDEQMRQVRITEQRNAALVGRYAAMFQLDYPSAEIKNSGQAALREDLVTILKAARPEIVYTHNPADKHDTHIAVVAAVIAALRSLPRPERPRAVYGCEVWRDLDWLPDDRKVALDVSSRQHLAAALTGLFDSQIAGGKRYDLATLGRFRANATYAESHGVDTTEGMTFAMDLTPLVHDETLDLTAYVTGLIRDFEKDVRNKLARMSSPRKTNRKGAAV